MSLLEIQTPTTMIDTIKNGIEEWGTHKTLEECRSNAPSAGSVKPADILVTQAFIEQRDEFGWEKFLTGRISKK